jgi:hypothetical protein
LQVSKWGVLLQSKLNLGSIPEAVGLWQGTKINVNKRGFCDQDNEV